MFHIVGIDLIPGEIWMSRCWNPLYREARRHQQQPLCQWLNTPVLKKQKKKTVEPRQYFNFWHLVAHWHCRPTFDENVPFKTTWICFKWDIPPPHTLLHANTNQQTTNVYKTSPPFPLWFWFWGFTRAADPIITIRYKDDLPRLPPRWRRLGHPWMLMKFQGSGPMGSPTSAALANIRKALWAPHS